MMMLVNWLFGYLVIWLSGYLVIWLFACPYFRRGLYWLFGDTDYLMTGASVHPPDSSRDRDTQRPAS